MAEPLRNHFDDWVPRTIARQLVAAWPPFPADPFLANTLDGYDALGLMDRGRHIARALRRHLPTKYEDALAILLRSVGPRPGKSEGDGGMASFLYLPHVQFVAEFGLDDFAPSLHALHLLTQRFTAEFSIRPFLERHERATLSLLRTWAGDPDAHVRRLVSEGTRPRLPWATRLRRFQADPAPVVALLELLKDDPEPFVRRSVANNLNDIGRDHPDVLIAVGRRWLRDAGDERRALVRHALRSLVKQGQPDALELLGFGARAAVIVEDVRIAPARPTKGESLTIEFAVRGTGPATQQVLVDLCVHFMKASGATSPKVFKVKTVELAPGDTARCRKTVSLADLTTRRHHAGEHRVEALLNGRAEPLGTFLLEEAAAPTAATATATVRS